MFRNTAIRAGLFGFAILLSGCMNAPDATRAAPNETAIVPAAIGELDLRFRASTPETIYFDFNSSELDQKARRRLDRQLRWIQRNPEARFSVTGHTDRVGNESYNRRLGLRRARAAVAYLIESGVSENRLVAMVSLGEAAPRIDTDERERRNRRVVTQVIGRIERSETVLAPSSDQVPALAPQPTVSSPVAVSTPNPSPSAQTTSTPAPASAPTPEAPAAPEPAPAPEPTPAPDPAPTVETGKSKANNGKGNGSEGDERDPGKSGKTKAANND